MGQAQPRQLLRDLRRGVANPTIGCVNELYHDRQGGRMISKFQTRHDRAGATLRAIRAALGMTQGQMAEALGFSSTATIAHYENGRRALPIDVLYQAADIAGYEMRLVFTRK